MKETADMANNDLRTMSADDLLDRLHLAEKPPQIDTLIIARACGLTDVDMLIRRSSDLAGEAGPLLAFVAAHSRDGIFTPLTEADIDTLVEVGAEVYARDRENVEDWARLAQMIADADRDGWEPRTSRHSYRWDGAEETRNFFAALLAAGRGPIYARVLVQRAAELHVSPDTYGFGPAITAAVFSDLVKAGVGGPELERLAAEGIDMDAAIALIADGCPAGALIAAKQLGFDKPTWRERCAGMNPSWFPLSDGHQDRPMDPVAAGVIGRQRFTWEQLRALVDNGWGQVGSFHLLSIRYGSGRRSGGTITLTPTQAVNLSESGLTPDAVERWATAMTTASKDDRVPQFARPLVSRGHFDIERDVPLIQKMVAAKVSPSNLNAYRYAGCTSIEDIITAAEAGITGSRADHLRKTYGRSLSNWDKRFFLTSLTALMDAHHQDEAAKATADADGAAVSESAG